MNIAELAKELGFDEARPVDASLFPEAETLLPGARTLWVLLTAHVPYDDASWPEDAVRVAAFYPVSQEAYHRTRRLADRLRENGVRVLANPYLPAKRAAEAAGMGWMGRQELLHHPKYGTYISLHLLLTDRAEEYPPAEKLPAPCGSCTLCMDACPTGAVRASGRIDPARCLRAYMLEGRKMPEDMLPYLGKRLVGCEECQRACPHNRAVGTVPVPAETAGMLRLLNADEETIRKAAHVLAPILGPNLIRPLRLTEGIRALREGLQRKENENG